MVFTRLYLAHDKMQRWKQGVDKDTANSNHTEIRQVEFKTKKNIMYRDCPHNDDNCQFL